MGGQCHIHEIAKHTTVEDLVNFHIYCQEFAMRKCAESSAKNQLSIETITFVIDADGWNLQVRDPIPFKRLQIAVPNDT